MKRFLRLMRYGLPYTFQWLPGIFLLAMVGLLESLRIVLFVPILGVGSKSSHASPMNSISSPWRLPPGS